MSTLREKIESRAAVVGVVGLGYVGLPLARVFVDAGFRVLGFDVDPAKITALGRGESYLKHLGPRLAEEMNATGRFAATADCSRLGEADAVLICVPTPLGSGGKGTDPDLSYVERTARDIAATLRAGQLVVLESTTYPGTTREVVLPILAATGLACGVPGGFMLAFSPEREDPGRVGVTTAEIPKVVGGVDAASGEAAAALYAKAFATVVPVASAEVAEAAKILENTYRAVNIALVNELKVLFEKMGIDVWAVIEAAKTKPFGFQAFYPGPGLGGHCIPIDPFYLAWKARQIGMPTRFIELAGEINHAMPGHVVERLAGALKERGKSVKGARVLVLGLAYKPDIDDVRESPSFEIIEGLRDLGASVDYNDPHVARTHQMRKYDLKMESVELSAGMLRGYDAVVISTAHRAYDWEMIGKNARLIVDTRNAMREWRGDRGHIVMA
ncbi:MAG TPA: nucleotide sugar dehydrogenase [Phycisphaerales bacterium]|nr:nucleotide sugar dehydrogenase [Phycisphaerales bacterium]